MIRHLFLLLITILTLPSAGSATPARRALVIGLGEQQDPAWARINGDKDVPLITGMLRANGFSHITTLVNSRASKNAIVNAMNTLVNDSRPGDIVYIHFSGHGQRMTDLDGDEDDGWDEAWIPYDACLAYGPGDRGEKHLSDDEIAVILGRLRRKVGAEGTIAVVVDACHSGQSTRDTDTDSTVVVRGVFNEFILPGPAKQNADTIAENWLTLSACEDWQLNQEFQGTGKLTHVLVNHWQQFSGQTDEAMFTAVDSLMRHRPYKSGKPQNPVMTGRTGTVLSKIFRKR